MRVKPHWLGHPALPTRSLGTHLAPETYKHRPHKTVLRRQAVPAILAAAPAMSGYAPLTFVVAETSPPGDARYGRRQSKWHGVATFVGYGLSYATMHCEKTPPSREEHKYVSVPRAPIVAPGRLRDEMAHDDCHGQLPGCRVQERTNPAKKCQDAVT